MTMDAWATEHFTKAELSCKHCGKLGFSPSDLLAIEEIREAWDRPMILSSAYRCKDHPEELKKPGGPGAHCQSCALDVVVSGELAYHFLALAIKLGWSGIGLAQKGPQPSRFVHIDRALNNPKRSPRPTIWTY